MRRITAILLERTPPLAAIAALILLACTGCYDGEALVQAAHSSAVKTRLAEVDFGIYQTTLPRDKRTYSFTELRLHIFGAVPRYRVAEVERQLKAEAYRVRHETLAALRTASPDELAEPNLTKLRDRLENVVNEILLDGPVKSIGFYQITLRRR